MTWREKHFITSRKNGQKLLRRARAADDACAERIRGAAHFEVQMRARRISGRTDITDDRALLNGGSEIRDVAAHMRIEGLRAVAVVDDDVIAVAAVPSARNGNDYFAGSRCINRRS